jgi:hypothetical protein
MKKLFLMIALVASMSAFAEFKEGMSKDQIEAEVAALLSKGVPMADIIADATIAKVPTASVETALKTVETAKLIAQGQTPTQAAAEAAKTVSTASAIAVVIVQQKAAPTASGTVALTQTPAASPN